VKFPGAKKLEDTRSIWAVAAPTVVEGATTPHHGIALELPTAVAIKDTSQLGGDAHQDNGDTAIDPFAEVPEEAWVAFDAAFDTMTDAAPPRKKRRSHTSGPRFIGRLRGESVCALCTP
jgi:hypothetical protein